MDPLNFNIEIEHIRKEKDRARLLRATQWWKRKIAKGICYYCKHPVKPKELTMDHIVPLSRGGLSTKGNVVPSCKTCNNRKKQLLPMEWDQYLKNISDSV
jgi:5-methylcytosine-specific restriction enzyme A